MNASMDSKFARRLINNRIVRININLRAKSYILFITDLIISKLIPIIL